MNNFKKIGSRLYLSLVDELDEGGAFDLDLVAGSVEDLEPIRINQFRP
jgi:hypothetical protein